MFKSYKYQNLLTVFLSLILLFGLAEATLRIKGLFSDVSGGNSSHQIIKHSYYNPFLIFGPDINKKLKQNNGEFVYWNSQGFRMNEDVPIKKAPGEYRIFALGGSTTEDVQNGQNLHYCGEANKIFEQKFRNQTVHCINAGKSAFTSLHSLVRLQSDILPYKPDMVTVMHNINDLTVNLYPFDGRYNYGNKYLGENYAPTIDNRDFLWQIMSKFKVFSYIGNKVSKVRILVGSRPVHTLPNGEVIRGNTEFKDGPMELPFKEVFRSNLRSIAAIGKAEGIAVVFLTQPAVFSDEKYYSSFAYSSDDISYPRPAEFKRAFEEYNTIIREVARETGSPLVDLYDLIGHDEKYFVDVVHTSADGVRRVGNFYGNELIKLIK